MKATKKFCDGCRALTYIWKNVMEEQERKRYCKGCWSCHELNQGKKHKPTRSKKPLAPRSAKRAKQETKYNREAKVFKEENPNCKAGIPGKCTGMTTEVHHIAGRIGLMLLYQPYWLPTCHECHVWIEAHPIEAKELGYSMSKTNTDIPDGEK